MLFPSGPGLARDLWRDEHYRHALQRADLVFADSGAMVLFWKILSGQTIPRYSGLRMFAEVLQHPLFCEVGSTFWVMPSPDQLRANLQWLQKTQALPVSEADCYCAPWYGPGRIEDRELLAILQKKRPRFIILCIGGGVQERLGCFLRKELGRSVSILCTGAAIGFCSGVQVRIPQWADFMFLGWLFRCVSTPKIFIPRYLRSLRLIKVVFLYWLYGRVPN
jgi:UDP-N-acetyl-D-mannosaminuronic acid transferase (WecB/TagA/CpsF family)